MIIEVKKFPESQEVMDKDDWFFLMTDKMNDSPIGHAAWGRILDESEYILVEKTTADEYNK